LRHQVSSLILTKRPKNYHEPDSAGAEMLGGNLPVPSSLGAGARVELRVPQDGRL
jgi:hypothetical protein